MDTKADNGPSARKAKKSSASKKRARARIDEEALDAARKAGKAKVKALSDSISTQAEEVLNTLLPTKVVQLHALVKSDLFNLSGPAVTEGVTLPELKETPRAPPSGADDGEKGAAGADMAAGPAIPSNERLVGMMDTLKSHLNDNLQYFGKLKTWIQLLIPEVMEGHNFGVGVQEECVSELSRAEDTAYQHLDSMSKYFSARARHVKKSLKHPNVTDFQRAIVECDEMAYLNLRMCATDMRNTCATLHDMISKNKQKLIKPRGSTNPLDSLY